MDRVAQHPKAVHLDLGSGENVQVPEPEHPAEDVLVEFRVVDLLERAVGRVLVQQALDLDHSAIGHEIALVVPFEPAPEDPEQTGDDQPEPAVEQQVADRPIRIEPDDEDEQGDGHENDRPA